MLEGKQRPAIPDSIKKDIKEESHYGCAICGGMDNGEVAHIRSVSETMNNAPDNLIYLCPSHHTKYDYGYKANTNITAEVIQAAKVMKKASRQRMLRYEANTSKLFCSLIATLKDIERKIMGSADTTLIQVYTTELRKLTETLPGLSKQALDNAKKDKHLDNVEKVILEKIPKLASLANKTVIGKSDQSLRSAVSSIVSQTSEILIDIDEVACPHCHGRGQTGLVGDVCAYCNGSCVITQAKADKYDVNDIDEVDCPHCGGRGQTGLVGDICAYCNGSCVVTQEKADSYDAGEIDEVDCPHCGGRGQTGMVGDICVYCNGSCVITQAKAAKYDIDEIDEVDCPHCGGQGQTGLVGDLCAFCQGSCFVTQKKADSYDPDEIDEVECPHCHGSGQTGLVGDICALCNGSCVVTEAKLQAYRKKYGR